jgi:hypothetical protein
LERLEMSEGSIFLHLKGDSGVYALLDVDDDLTHVLWKRAISERFRDWRREVDLSKLKTVALLVCAPLFAWLAAR